MFDLITVKSDNYKNFKNLISGHMDELVKKDKSIFMVGVLSESKAVGIAILKPEIEDMISLLYIYIDEKERRKGIGRFMIDSLVNMCLEDEKLLICTFPGEPDSYLYDIFDESGDFAITKEDGFRCSINLGEIIDATSDIKIDKYKKNLFTYDKLPGGKRNKYLDSLIENNLLNMDYKQSSFNKKYSLCYLNNDEIVGTIIVENLSKDNYSVSLLYCQKNYEMFIMPLIVGCVQQAFKDLPVDTVIHMDMASEISAKFIKKLLPSIQITGYYYTAVMDDTEWD